ncbi:MAG TPA: LptF/LptG family permease [Persephonella sp.]|uniref:Putative permease, YjgP/YjgQ family n=1 Tax=Persephonella marina (strain DSM 14350 / EX-H1) TaxID=123214 RepID=C0QS39_PERMH|nr:MULTISPECIES: LptF/LptG family permease [Persephonella]ACO04665.1 putative permease, YjgP/YjgQ family [Persephonella marina EX-H1]HCB69230.1 LptF/LptG family permease [Persephonella sp.]
MKILYRYITKNILKNFLVLIAVFSIVIVSSQLLHLPSVMYHADITNFFKLLFLMNLSFLKFQLLFAFFLSTALLGFNMRENREIYAVYSAGITKGQLIKPLVVISLIIFTVSLIVSMFVVPYANRERAKFITLNIKRYFLDAVQEKNFFQLSDNVTIYTEKKEGNRFENVFIYNRERGQTISAKEAFFDTTTFFLKKGYIQIPDEKGFNILRFESYRFNIDVEYLKKYSIEDYRNKDLLMIIKKSKKDKNRALSVLTDRILFPFPFLFIGVLGFMVGIKTQKGKDSVIATTVLISIVYLVLNFYFIKLIGKGKIDPSVYAFVLLAYFSSITYYFYRK